MPEDKTPTGAEGFPNPAENNDEVARKLADQGAPKTTNPEELVEAADALDKLASEKAKNDETEKKKAEEKAEAEKKSGADSEAGKKKAEEGAAKAEEGAAKAEEESKRAEEIFKDSPQLPAGASPKSAEAFSAIRIRAAQEINSRDQKIAELTRQNQELDAKIKGGNPALDKELEDLRLWRAKMDVEVDPKFQEFNKTIGTAHEFIYAQLKKHSPVITDDVIAEIKKYGGPENVNMAKIFDAIKDPTTQRLVESKMADIEVAKFNREQAIKQAKDNVKQYLEERQKSFDQSVTAHNTATKKHLDELVLKLDWFKEKQLDGKASDAEKEAIETHNEFISTQRKNLEAALGDDSPEMRAILITGMLQFLYAQRVIPAQVEKIKSLEAAIKERDEKIEKMKSGSLSRLKETGAPPNGSLPTTKKELDLTTPATQALDDIAKSIMEKKARAAGTPT